jgi:hypothetical protein
MRKRPRGIRHYKQIYSSSSPLGARRQSAVFACPDPYDVEDTTQKPPPFEAWPEIVQHNRFCVLPTVRALYHPRPSLFQNSALSYKSDDVTARNPEFWDGFIDYLVNMIPILEPYKTQIFPMIREVYQENIGTPLPETFAEAMAYSPYYVLRIFNALIMGAIHSLDASKQSEVMNLMAKSMGITNTFSNAHESMHLFL